MTTATPADIPTLTSIEIDAALASVEPGAPPPLQLAAQLKLPPHELLEILARPHVAAFAEAARAFVSARAEILASYTWITALQNLAEIAQNKEADIQSRLHAAIAILRDVRGGPPVHTVASPARLSHAPSTSPAPRYRLPPPPASAMPGAPPQPCNTTSAAQAPPPRPDRPAREGTGAALADPPRTAAPARPTAAAPIAIHRAAGAPIARRDRSADREDTDHPLGAASPPAAARPP